MIFLSFRSPALRGLLAPCQTVPRGGRVFFYLLYLCAMNEHHTSFAAPSALPASADLLFAGQGLGCIRGDRVVFRGLNFACRPGDALLLLGRNGSGKSSLLRVMAGLVAPAAGSLRWQGQPIVDDREGHGLRTRYLGHADAIKPVLTVAENVAFWVRLWAPDCPDIPHAVGQALDLFDMRRLSDVPGRFLSAGQKRRVNLARLFAAPGHIWLLDEPTTALDKASIAVLEQQIAAHRARGGIVALSTHTDVDLPQATAFQMEDFAPTLFAHDDMGEDGDDNGAFDWAEG